MIIDNFGHYQRYCQINIKIDSAEEAELLLNDLLSLPNHERYLPLVDVLRLTSRTLEATRKPDVEES